MPTTSAEKVDLRQWARERGYPTILTIEPENLVECYDDFRAWQAKKIEDRSWPNKAD